MTFLRRLRLFGLSTVLALGVSGAAQAQFRSPNAPPPTPQNNAPAPAAGQTTGGGFRSPNAPAAAPGTSSAPVGTQHAGFRSPTGSGATVGTLGNGSFLSASGYSGSGAVSSAAVAQATGCARPGSG